MVCVSTWDIIAVVEPRTKCTINIRGNRISSSTFKRKWK